MATTYDYSTNTYFGIGANANGLNKQYVVSRKVDLADAASAFGLSAFGANDVLKIFRVPANTLVLGVMAVVNTADSTVTDCDLGDGIS